MFGGNATERRRRRERAWGAIGFLAFSGVAIWLMSTDPRTDPSHMILFWICFAIAVPLGSTLVWKNADKEPGDPSVKGYLWLGFAGAGAHNLLENVRFVIGFFFGAAGGAFAGAALALLLLVLTRRPQPVSPATKQPGDSSET